MVGAATQADPLPSAVRPTRLTADVGWACESRTPVELPRYSVATILLRKPRQHGVAGTGAPERSGQRGQDVLERPGIGLLGFEPERTRAGRVWSSVDEGEGVGCRWRLPRRRPKRPPPSPPRRPCRPRRCRARRADRLAGERDDADRASPLDAVGRGRVQGVAHVDVAGLLDQHHAAVRAERVRRGQGALHQLLGRNHDRAAEPPEPAKPPRPASPTLHHLQRPDSSRVFSTRTPRTNADGQPCETGATCPGWPLPQLKAPPSTQVDSPPTASMAPQKSVVVA